MRARPLGRTGLVVSELALGTWGLSGDAYGPVEGAEAERTIDRAIGLGVSLYETADVYGRGEMERLLGRRLRGAYGPVHVVTKIGTDLASTPPRKRFDAAFVREAVERSRERLGADRLDVCLLHNPTMLALVQGEAAAALEALRAEGAIRAWGVSAGSVEVARAAITRGAQVIELVYNALLSRDLHQLAADVTGAGVGVLARSVLAHGLLSGFWGEERTFDEGDHRAERWSPEELRRRIRQLRAVRPLVAGDVLTLRAAALRFVLANELVSSAVLGPRSTAQLEQLVREAGKGPPYLPDAALAALPERLRAVGVIVA